MCSVTFSFTHFRRFCRVFLKLRSLAQSWKISLSEQADFLLHQLIQLILSQRCFHKRRAHNKEWNPSVVNPFDVHPTKDTVCNRLWRKNISVYNVMLFELQRYREC